MTSVNSSEFLADWNEEVGQNIVINAVTLCIYLLLGVTGNILVLVVYRTRLRNAPSERYFIPVLAVSDIFATIFGSVNCLLLDIMQTNFTNEILCKYLFFTITISAAMSIFILLSIALQRYLLICRKISIRLSVRRIMVGVSLFFSIVSAIPFLFNYGINDFYSEGVLIGTRCGRLKNRNYNEGVGYAIFFVGFLAFTLSALLFFYGSIGCVIFRQFKSGKSGLKDVKSEKRSDELDLEGSGPDFSSSPTPIGNETSSASYGVQGQYEISHPDAKQKNYQLQTDLKDSGIEKEIKIINNDKPIIRRNTHARRRNRKLKIKFSLMFMIVTTVSLVCYCPVGLIVVMEGFDPEFWDNLSRKSFLVILWLYHTYIINSCVNPVLYAFLDSEFNAALKSVFRRCCKR